MEGRLGHDQAMRRKPFVDRALQTSVVLASAVIALAVGTLAPARGQIIGERPVRYGVTSSFWYDGRADNRDFPSNGVFPGNFAADPITAAIGGAAGFLESNPRRSAVPYPSQTYVGPVRNLTWCQRYPAYDLFTHARIRC